MNIKEFLHSYYSSLYCNTVYTEYNSYIEVHNSVIIGNEFNHDVVINEVLDVQEHCHLSNATIENIINTKGSVHTTSNLLPGSFVGDSLCYNNNVNERIIVNGYITQSGIIS